ncbi:hypothetical protein KDH_02620 [Dictyobacter sp. S3.2.2.5]|uniref:Major facilitator superfamily (MFS) profile domain-containing protein n=2 Tax=Dictyobacter halimunensis TaxID=3026934 RepID=A0ABQ6FLJ1_9CHLR|nr:hypothetical protein KDH_02620 [Dictyobacter sp. S3.2.2.5]
MNGWSGVYLHDTVRTDLGFAALGYTIYTCMMTAGRLMADAFVARVGARWFVRCAALFVIGGMSLVLLFATALMTLIGYGLLGLGVAGIAPIVLREVGHRGSGKQAGPAIAAVTTLGYFGSLCGPALIGWLAQLSTLRLALGLILISSCFIALFAGQLTGGHLHRER